MKTEFEYLRFDKDGDEYVCHQMKPGGDIGIVYYEHHWAGWVFKHDGVTQLDLVLLKELVEFMEQLK